MVGPTTGTSALDGTDLAKMRVPFVGRPVDMPPQNRGNETPADNALEYAKVTPRAVLGRAWLLCSRASLQVVFQVSKLRHALVGCILIGRTACGCLDGGPSPSCVAPFISLKPAARS